MFMNYIKGCDGSKWNMPPYLPRSLDGNSLFHKVKTIK